MENKKFELLSSPLVIGMITIINQHPKKKYQKTSIIISNKTPS